MDQEKHHIYRRKCARKKEKILNIFFGNKEANKDEVIILIKNITKKCILFNAQKDTRRSLNWSVYLFH